MRPPRVLLAKPGLDGHDRGVKVVAMALRDAGAEVIYLGQRQSSDQILKTAMDEDVDVIGLSLLSGAHLPLTRDLLDRCEELGVDVPVVVGGTIPAVDRAILRDWGVHSVFPAGSGIDGLVADILALAGGRVQGTTEQ